MDPPDSTETNLSLKSKILDEKSSADVPTNDDFFDDFLISISSDCKYPEIKSDHESNEGYSFSFSQDIKKEDSDSLASESCVPKPSVPVISEVSTMIEKLKGQNKEIKDKNVMQEIELVRYEERLAREMNALLKIQMERDTLKENLAAVENERITLEVKLAEKEAELKQFKELAQKSMHDSNELVQLRKDLNASAKSLKKADKDLLAAQAYLNKKNTSLRKLRGNNRKLLATVLEFGSVLEDKGLLTPKQLKYLKTVKEVSSAESSNCEIKENASFEDEDEAQNNLLNGYDEAGSFNSGTLNTDEVKIETECDYGLQNFICNGVADKSNYNGVNIHYSHNRKTQNSSVNNEDLHSHPNDESFNGSFKHNRISISSEVAASTLNSNHLFSSNVENLQNSSSLFSESNKLSPDSNFVPIFTPRSESVCSEDFMDFSDEDVAAMQQTWFKCERLKKPLSPLPPTPPPSQYKSKITNSVKKVGNQSSSLNAVPSLSSTSSKDVKMSPKPLDKRHTLSHQTSGGFELQIDESSSKPKLSFGEHSVSVSENVSDLILPSNLYYVSARQVDNSFLINGFGNGHLEYLLDFQNGNSVLAITPSNSENTTLNQTNANISAGSQGVPLTHANRRLGLLLSHYQSYSKNLLANSQHSVSLQEQVNANNKVSEKFLHSTPIQPKNELKPILDDVQLHEPTCDVQKSTSAFVSPKKEMKSLNEKENSFPKSVVKTDDNQFFVSSSCDSLTPSKRKFKHLHKTPESLHKNVSELSSNKFDKSHSAVKAECETNHINVCKKKKISENILETDFCIQEHGTDIKPKVNSQNLLNLSDCSKLPGVLNLESDNPQTQLQVFSCNVTHVKKESETDSLSKFPTEFKAGEKILDTLDNCNTEECALSGKEPPCLKNVLDSKITDNIHLNLNAVKPDSKAENTIYPFVNNQSTSNTLESSDKDRNFKDKKNQIKRQQNVQFNETGNVADLLSPMKVVIPNCTDTSNLNPLDSSDACLKEVHKLAKKKVKAAIIEEETLTSTSTKTNSDISCALNDVEKPVVASNSSGKDSKVLIKNNNFISCPKKIDNKSKTGHSGVASNSLCTVPSTSIVIKPECNNVLSSEKNTNLSETETCSNTANVPGTKNKIKFKKTLAALKRKRKKTRKNKKLRNRQKSISSMSRINHSSENKSTFKNSLVKFVSANKTEDESEIKLHQNGHSKLSACVVNGKFDLIQAENEQNSILNQHITIPEHGALTKDGNPNDPYVHTLNPVRSSAETASRDCFLVKAEVHCNIDNSHKDKKSFSSTLLDTTDLPNENNSLKDSPKRVQIKSKVLPLSPGLFAVNGEEDISVMPYVTFKNGRSISSPTNHELDSVLSPTKSPLKKEISLGDVSAKLVNGKTSDPNEPVCSSHSSKPSLEVSSLGQDHTSKNNGCVGALNHEDMASPSNGISLTSQDNYLKQDNSPTICMNGDSYSHLQELNLNASLSSCPSNTVSDDENALIIAEDFEDEASQEEEIFEPQNANNAVDATPIKKKKSKKNKKSTNLVKKTQKRPKLMKDEPADNMTVTISKAFEEIEKLKFDDSHFKLRVHTLVNALINPANASDTVSVLFFVIQYLSTSRRNPLMTYTISHDSTALLPQLEKCIVTSLIQVEHKMKSHLKGLLSSAVNSLYLLVLAKDSIPIYGLCAFCRVFTEICKYTKNMKKPIMLCCDLLKMKHKFAPYLIASIIGVWPNIFAISSEASGVELMYQRSIVYGVEKKPQSLTDTQWKHCHSIFSKFLTIPTISNVIEATNDIIDLINYVLKEDLFEDEYMLIDPLVIFCAYEGWKWANENLLIKFVLPHLVSYTANMENERAFNLFCTLYSEIGLLCPDSKIPIDILRQFFSFKDAHTYVKPIAARSLLKLFLKNQSLVPKFLINWIQENETILTRPVIEVLLHRRIMSDTPELTKADIVSI